jgi:Uma2 family endonuclease
MGIDAPAAEVIPIPGPLRRFSVAEYHRLIDAELFDPDERIELLEGWIVAKMTRKPPHDAVVDRVAELLRQVLPPGLRVRIQSAITTEDSEPEPDLAVVRGGALDYAERHPGADDIALIVEVADSSVERDRAKARIYARAGIAGYWIVNLPEGWVEVYAGPSGPAEPPRYHRRQDYARGASVPLVHGDREVAAIRVDEMLPR